MESVGNQTVGFRARRGGFGTRRRGVEPGGGMWGHEERYGTWRRGVSEEEGCKLGGEVWSQEEGCQLGGGMWSHEERYGTWRRGVS